MIVPHRLYGLLFANHHHHHYHSFSRRIHITTTTTINIRNTSRIRSSGRLTCFYYILCSTLISASHPFSMTSQISTSSNNANNTPTSDPLRPVVFCGPSGVGKGTLINLLMERFPNDQFGFSVSHTTRPPRPGEQDGVHYHFTTVPQIQQEIKDNKFIEYAEVHGKYYGTSIEAVESVQKSGKICILDIDVQGVQKVKASQLQPPPRYIFIAPPSRDDLEKRLRHRNTETEEAIQTRLANAQTELDYGNTSGNFDRVFVNADLQACFKDLVTQFQEWYPHLVATVSEEEDKAKNEKNCTCDIS